MIVISSGEFRSKQKEYFEKADNGEQVVVLRGKNKAYTLIPVADDDWYYNPIMMEHLEKAIQEVKEGKVIEFSDKEEMLKYLDNL
ncbi:hypothetical protein EZS27_005198 [termite gut metagenome]|uniref:Antitoxin n=1 Tax=termite gut metagenome TaxID=433724 RepID=A0A5J4SMC9_9ZZZZ